MFNFSEDNKVLDFISNNHIGVIATTDNDNQPHTATIFYSFQDNSKIRFITKVETQKAQDLAKNSSAALTIIDRSNPIAVNMIGRAEQIKETAIHDQILQDIMKIARSKDDNVPPIVKEFKGQFVAFEFTPEVAKLTDYTGAIHSTQVKVHEF